MTTNLFDEIVVEEGVPEGIRLGEVLSASSRKMTSSSICASEKLTLLDPVIAKGSGNEICP